MSRWIVVQNLNNYIGTQSMASFQHAAQRWDARLLVITEPINPGLQLDPFGDKLHIGRIHLTYDAIDRWDQVAWFDGDTIIRSDAPSIFDMVEPEQIGTVANVQTNSHADPIRDHAPSWNRLRDRFGVKIDVPLDLYANGGVFVFTPECHGYVWEWAREKLSDKTTVGPMEEQTAWNLAMVQTGIPRVMLDETWNRIGPDVWNATGPMPWYVMHWANIHHHRGNKQAAMGRVEWEAIASAA